MDIQLITKLWIRACFLAFALIFTGCGTETNLTGIDILKGDSQKQLPGDVSVEGTTKELGEEYSLFLNSFNQMKEKRGIRMWSRGYTFFAPSNNAFRKLDEKVKARLAKEPRAIFEILAYHVVPQKLKAADVIERQTITNVAGKELNVKLEDGSVFIDDAKVIKTDIRFYRGIAHKIDKVIVPPTFLPEDPDPLDIVDTAAGAGVFNTLLAAADAAGLVDTLRSEGPFMVFAPTDDAFAAIPAETLTALLNDPDALREILLYHVVTDELKAAEVLASASLTMASGKMANITVNAEAAMIENAKIIDTDIIAANGVIHVIDAVLMPPKDIVEVAQAAGQFNTLLAAATAAGLVDTLKSAGPFTVFAPNDDAFAKIDEATLNALIADPEALKNILLYHVVLGRLMAADVLAAKNLKTVDGRYLRISTDNGDAFVDQAKIIATDVAATNGVIHVIDSVMMPYESILDVARAAGNFTTLLQAVEAAGLSETLATGGDFTLFAPTDEAFAKLPEGTVEALLQDPDTLRNILLFHGVQGKYNAIDFLFSDGLTALNGGTLAPGFDLVDWKILVNHITVAAADVQADNGVIHVIDEVLIP